MYSLLCTMYFVLCTLYSVLCITQTNVEQTQTGEISWRAASGSVLYPVGRDVEHSRTLGLPLSIICQMSDPRPSHQTSNKYFEIFTTFRATTIYS